MGVFAIDLIVFYVRDCMCVCVYKIACEYNASSSLSGFVYFAHPYRKLLFRSESQYDILSILKWFYEFK